MILARPWLPKSGSCCRRSENCETSDARCNCECAGTPFLHTRRRTDPLMPSQRNCRVDGGQVQARCRRRVCPRLETQGECAPPPPGTVTDDASQPEAQAPDAAAPAAAPAEEAPAPGAAKPAWRSVHPKAIAHKRSQAPKPLPPPAAAAAPAPPPAPEPKALPAWSTWKRECVFLFFEEEEGAFSFFSRLSSHCSESPARPDAQSARRAGTLAPTNASSAGALWRAIERHTRSGPTRHGCVFLASDREREREGHVQSVSVCLAYKHGLGLMYIYMPICTTYSILYTS